LIGATTVSQITVTSWSVRHSNANGYTVYLEASEDGASWTTVDSYVTSDDVPRRDIPAGAWDDWSNWRIRWATDTLGPYTQPSLDGFRLYGCDRS
jgi:hypothetical protein